MEKKCDKCFHYDACMSIDTEDMMNDNFHAEVCEHYIPSEYVSVNISDELWKEAVNYLNSMIAEYSFIGPVGMFGLQGVLFPLKKRYDNGERTIELYNAIMACE